MEEENYSSGYVLEKLIDKKPLEKISSACFYFGGNTNNLFSYKDELGSIWHECEMHTFEDFVTDNCKPTRDYNKAFLQYKRFEKENSQIVGFSGNGLN